MASLLLFCVLQCCDIATTLVFLGRGVPEANPLVAAALRHSTDPLLPLVVIKAAGCMLAWCAWRGNRLRLLRRINVLFGVFVAWNLAAIAAA